MTRFSWLCGSILALVALASSAPAARLYFTTSATSGAPKSGTPQINLTPGETTDLYVWVDLKGDGALGDGNDGWMNGYGLNIVATAPGVVETVSSELYNPQVIGVFAPGVEFPLGPRWPASNLFQPSINVGGAGSIVLAENARVFDLNTSGASGIGFTAQGAALPGETTRKRDAMYDAVNDVFLAQRITLKARDNGAGNQSTGIVMQVSSGAFSIDNNPLIEPIFFGAGQVPVPNNAVGGTDLSSGAHATIVVAGGAPARDALRFGADANSSAAGAVVLAGPNGGDPKNVAFAPGTSAGVVVVENWTKDVFEVFFDVEGVVDPVAALAELIAQSSNGEPSDGYQVFAALGTNELGNGIDYDFRVTIPHIPGTNAIVDFDFGTTATVANVGVPEPSTFVLGAIGCVAIVGLRRRRK